MKNRIISGIISVILISHIMFAAISPVSAAGNVINISSAEDFIKLSENASLDTWSQGKTVNLMCDIDFSKKSFVPIPTFGGTFNGNGYTVSGIKFEEKGSYQGIFRYVQTGGRVSNLNVKGRMTPNGSKGYIGGIVGENSGTVENCTFTGTVKGENIVGGIAGMNTDYGKIISCIVSGNVGGENFTGGIVGKNSGFIRNCTNNAVVNTVYEEKKNETTDIDTDVGAIIENYKMKEEESEEASVLGYSDTGGIVGYTSGIVQGCVNNGAVGYPHIGYNVGGIAGKQSGYMLGCENYGFIQGRKDVGGIAGQAEPYILLDVLESTLKDVHKEITNLNTMVNNFITDTDNLGDDADVHLKEISEYAKNAQDNTEVLINRGTDFIDDNLDEINAQSAILSNTLDKLIPVFDNLEKAGDDLSDSLNKIVDALKEIEINSPEFGDEIDGITDALSEIAKAEKSIKNAVSKADKVRNNLEFAIEFNNSKDVKNAVSDLGAAIKDIIKAKQTIKEEIGKIETIIKTKPENFDGLIANVKETVNILAGIKDNIGTTITSLKTINQSIDTVILNGEIDFKKFKDAVNNTESAVKYLADGMYHITDGIEDLGEAIGDLSDGIEDYADDVIDELKEARDNLTDAVDLLSNATDDLKTSIEDIKDILTDLSNEEELEFVKLGDEFRDASDDLFDSLSGISDEIDGLRNTVTDGTDNIANSLTAISNQFNLIVDLLADEVERVKDGTENISDIFLDVSDEDIESAKQGKIEDCRNFGTVEADRNVGGVAGAMAIEYSKDPEDDIEKPDTLNFTYRTRAILQDCINDGKVTGKKDCVGGIVGFSEIGTVYECQNYVDVESTNGNYVGGIAGKSESAIRKSYAKSKITGKRYIGGVAGKADIVTASYAIVNIDAGEDAGAICGYAVNKDNLYRNFFVNNGVGAVDGISYTNKAEPISFDKLKDVNAVPARFISFSVKFIADDKIIETQDVKYGEDTKRIKYPKVPEKDGHFGVWQRTESETVTENIEIICEYQPYITVLSSNAKNENGKLAVALAEGKFTDKAKLNVKESKENPPVKAGENVKVYDISLLNTDVKPDETVVLRMINENKSNVSVWVLTDGEWQEIETKDKGKYVKFQMTGTDNTICLRYEGRNVKTLMITVFVTAAVFAVLIIIRSGRKRKRKSVKVTKC